jgi:excisionase family DNA binding protein
MTGTRDTMTVGEARAYLQVSKPKMAKLIRDGVLTTEPDPLDGRIRLIRCADVEELAARSSKNAA